MKKEELIKSKLDIASERYNSLNWLRALVNAVPYIGGAVDVLITGKHSQIVQRRIESLINELKANIEGLEEDKIDFEYLDSEDAHDLFFLSFEKVSKIKDAERISAIGKI